MLIKLPATGIIRILTQLVSDRPGFQTTITVNAMHIGFLQVCATTERERGVSIIHTFTPFMPSRCYQALETSSRSSLEVVIALILVDRQ